MKKTIIMGLTCMGLAACSAPGVSPKDANLLEAMGNLQSGEFDRQLQRKQLQLEGSQAELSHEVRKQNSLQSELGNKQQELATLEGELADIKHHNRALERKISQQQAQTRQQQAKKQELLEKIAANKKKIAATESVKPINSANSGIYQKRIEELKQEIQTLQNMATN